MKRDGTGLKESGGEGIACGVGRSVVTRGVAWIHDLGVLQEEWLRGVCFAVLASPCLLRGVCVAVLALRGLYPGAYFKVTTSKFQLRNFVEASDFARLKLCGHQTLRSSNFAVIRLCGWQSLRVLHFACNGTEVEGLLGHQFGAVA